ncbi:MAG TPA: hypothetical protein VF744_18640 [Beijerinckiaceae bacterium]|jgi:hypothetical protein
MSLLGTAAVAMWWDIAPAVRAEFEDWHSHEHFPERMSIPGFRRGSRWASEDGEGFFVLYELDAYETLTSPGYLSRLNNPTPWSTKMMPHHRNMVRSQCRVLESGGGGLARFMLTLRLSPAAGRAGGLHDRLKALVMRLPALPGLTGAHLLRTETPAAPATTEQKIRGGDAVADWILLVSGYDSSVLETLSGMELGPIALEQAGALPSATASVFRLSYSVTANDL